MAENFDLIITLTPVRTPQNSTHTAKQITSSDWSKLAGFTWVKGPVNGGHNSDLKSGVTLSFVCYVLCVIFSKSMLTTLARRPRCKLCCFIIYHLYRKGFKKVYAAPFHVPRNDTLEVNVLWSISRYGMTQHDTTQQFFTHHVPMWLKDSETRHDTTRHN